jgi:hypothetical protein
MVFILLFLLHSISLFKKNPNIKKYYLFLLQNPKHSTFLTHIWNLIFNSYQPILNFIKFLKVFFLNFQVLLAVID